MKKRYGYVFDYGSLGWSWRCLDCGASSCGLASKRMALREAEAGHCGEHFPGLTKAEIEAQS